MKEAPAWSAGLRPAFHASPLLCSVDLADKSGQSTSVARIAASKGAAAHRLPDPGYAALRHRLDSAHVAAETVASAWQSRALVCARSLSRIG